MPSPVNSMRFIPEHAQTAMFSSDTLLINVLGPGAFRGHLQGCTNKISELSSLKVICGLWLCAIDFMIICTRPQYSFLGAVRYSSIDPDASSEKIMHTGTVRHGTRAAGFG